MACFPHSRTGERIACSVKPSPASTHHTGECALRAGEGVVRLMAIVDELEAQVEERKEKAERLMQAVLREAFEG